MRPGNGSCRNRSRGEDFQLAYGSQCPNWPMGSQRCLAEVGGWDKTVSQGRDIRWKISMGRSDSMARVAWEFPGRFCWFPSITEHIILLFTSVS